MKKSYGVLALVTAALMPLAPFLYLYNRNSAYLDASQALIVMGVMLVIGCAGFGVWKMLFRSNTAALAGCGVLWTMFFLFTAFYRFVEGRSFYSPYVTLPLYAAAAFVLALAIGFVLRKVQKDGWIPALALILGIMILMNGVPAGVRAVRDRQSSNAFDKRVLKLDFVTDETTASPNVYWIHCDGMLGFDAMRTYYGDDQAQFKAELAARGFLYNEQATLEAAHKTEIAVAALMCPAYCDSALYEVVRDHERAMQSRQDETLRKGELSMARIYNETVRAFAQKGYHTDMIAGFTRIFTPLVDRFYNTSEVGGATLLKRPEGEDAIIDWYLDLVVSWREMGELLFGGLSSSIMRGLIAKEPLTVQTDDARIREILENTQSKKKYVNLIRCLNDSLASDEPALRVVNLELAHYPFLFDENGAPQSGDSNDIRAYGAQHAYATKVLIRLIDLILAHDPDAVIVLQSDHGLHGQTEAQITRAFGADAVLPIWNNVMSAIRVPEQYQTPELAKTMETPLNMARYLVNSYVGENYRYFAE